MDLMTNSNTPTQDTYAEDGMTNTGTPSPDTYASGEELDSTPAEGTTLVSDEEFTPGAGNFVANLPYMGKGMLAIFVVIAVIMGVTALLNKVFKK